MLSPSPEMKVLPFLAKTQILNFCRRALFQMKPRLCFTYFTDDCRIGLNFTVLNWKLLCKNLLNWFLYTFINVNSNETIISLITKSTTAVVVAVSLQLKTKFSPKTKDSSEQEYQICSFGVNNSLEMLSLNKKWYY